MEPATTRFDRRINTRIVSTIKNGHNGRWFLCIGRSQNDRIKGMKRVEITAIPFKYQEAWYASDSQNLSPLDSRGWMGGDE